MDDRNIRTERTTTDVASDYGQNVDIRRTMIMGRDLDMGTPRLVTMHADNKALRWGPIMAGLTTTLVVSLLVGCLFLGLGFNRSYGVFGGLTGNDVGWGAIWATAIGVIVGGYLAGFGSDLRTRSEGILNGFMVGVMAILTPLLLGVLGTYGAANTAVNAAAQTLPKSANPALTTSHVAGNVAASVPSSVTNSVGNAFTIAASNAWVVFWGGLVILGIATLCGYLGSMSRAKSLNQATKRNIDANTVV